MANAVYQLGMIAHRQEQLDVAETWYRQALGLYEDLGDKSQIACTYHELGMVAHGQGAAATSPRTGTARRWFSGKNSATTDS